MSETANIAEMSAILSDEVFSIFGWTKTGPADIDFECKEQEKHRRTKKKTHPTDVVFKYVDPYRGKDIYVLTDLKSYAKGSLVKNEVIEALRSLSRTVECANKSLEWKTQYVDQTRNNEVIGMLFVYNNDCQYDKDFSAVLEAINPSQYSLSPGYFVNVIGPERVIYLNSIAKDIKVRQAEGVFPPKEDRFFYAPHLSRAAALHKYSPYATLPVLLGSIIIVGYCFPEKPHSEGFQIYYDGPGGSKEEFLYLIDYLFKYQMADEHTSITFNLAFPHPDAATYFNIAKKEFARDFWPVTENTTRAEVEAELAKIEYRDFQIMIQKFSTKKIGMQRAAKRE
jgi:hypothetical protein